MKSWLQRNRQGIVYTVCTVATVETFALLSVKSDIALYGAILMGALILTIISKQSKL
jgi:hypothetical protein